MGDKLRPSPLPLGYWTALRTTWLNRPVSRLQFWFGLFAPILVIACWIGLFLQALRLNEPRAVPLEIYIGAVIAGLTVVPGAAVLYSYLVLLRLTCGESHPLAQASVFIAVVAAGCQLVLGLGLVIAHFVS